MYEAGKLKNNQVENSQFKEKGADQEKIINLMTERIKADEQRRQANPERIMNEQFF